MRRSSASQLEEFKKSIIWMDILDELGEWLEGVHAMLENPDRSLDHMALDRLGGNAESFHKFEDILDYMIANVGIEQENKELEKQLKREKEDD